MTVPKTPGRAAVRDQSVVDRIETRDGFSCTLRGVDPVEFLLREPEMLFALWRKRVVVQVRRGALLRATFERLRDHILWIARTAEPLGAILVVEDGAPIPGGDVRPLQRALVTDMLAQPNVRVATVTIGSGIGATLSRSAGRMVAMANPRLAAFDSVGPAARWIAQQLESMSVSVRVDELQEAVESLRREAASG